MIGKQFKWKNDPTIYTIEKARNDQFKVSWISEDNEGFFNKEHDWYSVDEVDRWLTDPEVISFHKNKIYELW